MPPAQLKVQVIRSLLGGLTDTHYQIIRDTLQQFIVSIGFYHLWYCDIPDRANIWTIILRIMHKTASVVPDPGPNPIPKNILMGAFHLFISCQKHLLSNKRGMYNEYLYEYDRCVLAGYDVYTCHHRGVYAGNVAWATHYPGSPMPAPLPQFPDLIAPPPIVPHLRVGAFIRKERGPPLENLVQPASYLPTSMFYWTTAYSGYWLPQDCIIPLRSWTGLVETTPEANIRAMLAALPDPGSLNIQVSK